MSDDELKECKKSPEDECQNPTDQMHTCPYREMVDGDEAHECDCCESCEYDCEMAT